MTSTARSTVPFGPLTREDTHLDSRICTSMGTVQESNIWTHLAQTKQCFSNCSVSSSEVFKPTGDYSLMGSLWGDAKEYFAYERSVATRKLHQLYLMMWMSA